MNTIFVISKKFIYVLSQIKWENIAEHMCTLFVLHCCIDNGTPYTALNRHKQGNNLSGLRKMQLCWSRGMLSTMHQLQNRALRVHVESSSCFTYSNFMHAVVKYMLKCTTMSAVTCKVNCLLETSTVIVWPPCCFEMYSHSSRAWIITLVEMLSGLGDIIAHLLYSNCNSLFGPFWLEICSCRLRWRAFWSQWFLQQPRLPQQVSRKQGVYLVYHDIAWQQHHSHYPWVWCGVPPRLQLWCAGSKIWPWLSVF